MVLVQSRSISVLAAVQSRKRKRGTEISIHLCLAGVLVNRAWIWYISEGGWKVMAMDDGSQSVGARSRRRQRPSVRSSLEDRKLKESSSSICLQKVSIFMRI